MKNILRTGTWVAVCDGQKALLFENTGDHVYPKLEMREVLTQDNPPTHAQGTSPPGHVASAAGRRSAVEGTDYHARAEEAFLRDFAGVLENNVERHKIARLVLVAPPRALGHLRQMIPAGARKVIVAELDHDYTHLPAYEIEQLLTRL